MAKRKYKINDNAFKTLNNNTAYWLGFLWGDGYVNGNRIQLSLKYDDRDHLNKFRGFLGSPTRPIRIFMDKTVMKQYCDLRVRSWEYKKDLDKFKITTNKRDRGRMPISLTQKEIRRHFLRGLFDADGCFYVDTRGYLFMEITGTMPTMKDVKNILIEDELINPSKKIVKNGSVFRIRLSASDTIRFAEYIYEGYPDITILSRKYFLYKSHAERLSGTDILHIK